MKSFDVHLFSYLRERHGAVVTVASEANAGAILDALAASGIATEACRLAVDDEFVIRSYVVATGASVALIPPVSGG
ncbi:MAG: MoaD/ThiS family protein [Fimbriimonas sp.]|nr:MoaD/ThiS family protein [Fimbriimonas sp.]